MEDRRRHPRRKTTCKIRLSNEHFGPINGNIRDLSESGVFVEVATTSDFSRGMLLEAEVLDSDWDQTLPPLTMKVVRIETDGIGLEFADPS
ncbi:PilZ domain-containing protein [Zobellella maritima]|uniref:PilZ domain-containing protein n=1 Tax=Zobellella maritima TaxID=2059725 RepID=UPI000E30A0AC|nr:PilZ domain-containing protein [Zobellella maritima]